MISNNEVVEVVDISQDSDDELFIDECSFAYLAFVVY